MIVPLCTAHLTAPPPRASILRGVSTPHRANMFPTPLIISQKSHTMWRRGLNTSTAGFQHLASWKLSKEPRCSCVSSFLPAWHQPWYGMWMDLGMGAMVLVTQWMVFQGQCQDIMETAMVTAVLTWRHSLPSRRWSPLQPSTSWFHLGSWWGVSLGRGSWGDASSTSLCSSVISS